MVWPLINFAEWVMSVLSRTMRECILQKGRIDWEGDASAPGMSPRSATNPWWVDSDVDIA
jgi:hypothetical protein